MTKLIRNNQKGFTLIELMIVVAIIGILAAIAIPNFLNYQLKSKTAEAKTNIGSIKTSQEAFKAEYDFYVICAANPAVAGIGPGKQAWGAPAAGTGWPEIGYAPSGDVYYSYETNIAGNAPAAAILGVAAANFGDALAIAAVGDLDGDGTDGEFAFCVDNNTPARAAAPVILTTALPAVGVQNSTLVDLAPGQY